MEGPDVRVALSGDKVLVIPTARNEAEQHEKKSAGHGMRKKSPYTICPSRPIQTRNYLMKGGQRALDRELQERWDAYKESTIADLVKANEALAKELVRLQNEIKNIQNQGEQDKEVLTAELTAMNDQEMALKEALKMCDERIKELHKKLREERTVRTRVESDQQETMSQLQSLEKRHSTATASVEKQEKSLLSLTEKTEAMTRELKETRETLAQTELRLQERSKALHEAKTIQIEAQERAQILEGTVQTLTHKATHFQKECQSLRRKAAEQTETYAKLKDELQKQEKQSERDAEMQGSLQDEIHSLHDLLNTERLAASKHQNEAKNLSQELEISKAAKESLSAAQEKLQNEMLDLKSALKQERDSNRELTRHCSKAKEKLESTIQEHKKREAEWSNDTKSKLEAIKHDIRVSSYSSAIMHSALYIATEKREFLPV